MENELLNIINLASISFLLTLVLVTAVHKIKQPHKFKKILLDYEILPVQLTLKLAKLVPFVELGVIATTIIAFALSLPLVSFSVLLVLYGAYTGIILFAWLKKRSLLDCGCSMSTSVVAVSPKYLLVRNLALMLLVGVYYVTAQQTAFTLGQWLVGLAISCFVFIAYSSLEGLVENQSLINKLKVKHD
ncbi:MauE/DoxX family redox-associated membrane protein [Paraglaciecola marina]|uniref:MauE/DoxX family redox-associated membrane protein n=1 Tax=Paraglaciecola marina TaxID=2500157 RepID=UPI001061FDF6|nr:MauE/DoxX family redox-associated membrane protein [Paraglaciecola marina]